MRWFFVLFFALSVYLKGEVPVVDIWKWGELWAKVYLKYENYKKTFVVFPAKILKFFTFDRDIFGARLLDFVNILERPYLYYSNQGIFLTENALSLDPKDLNAIVICVYQYTDDPKSFLKVDKLVKKHIEVAQKNWRTMLLMSFLWQFRMNDLDSAIFYANKVFENPSAPWGAKELLPALFSKVGKIRKAILFYSFLLKNAKTPTERELIRKKIANLEKLLKNQEEQNR